MSSVLGVQPVSKRANTQQRGKGGKRGKVGKSKAVDTQQQQQQGVEVEVEVETPQPTDEASLSVGVLETPSAGEVLALRTTEQEAMAAQMRQQLLQHKQGEEALVMASCPCPCCSLSDVQCGMIISPLISFLQLSLWMLVLKNT